MKKFYLLFFNIISVLGWASIFGLSFKSLISQKSTIELWKEIQIPLQITQSLAIFEIFHSILGIVPSPIISSILQVASRIIMVWCFTSNYSYQSWSLYLILLSWSTVEIPRYLYYSFNLFSKQIPSFIKFLRYNLFFILYPTGITGEILQIIFALHFLVPNKLLFYSSFFSLMLYVPCAPFLYFHMIGQRSKAYAPPPKEVKEGVLFPLDEKKERSSTQVNEGAFEASVKDIDPEEAKSCKNDFKKWRFAYEKHVINNVKLCCESKENALNIANAGLNYLHNIFEFHRDGKVTSLAEAMKSDLRYFSTGFIKGKKSKPKKFEYEIGYEGRKLKKEEIISKLLEWAKYGTIEPDTKEAIENVVKNEGWLDLSDKYFVLLGAGSAMGPFPILMELGANVIAIDINISNVWKRLFQIAENSCGTLTFPMKAKQNEIKPEDYCNFAGCDLFKDTPEVANFLIDTYPKENIIIGGYAYLDGINFLRVSIAMDAIMAKVLKARKNAGICFLCSPTDVFVCPEDAYLAMQKNYKNRPFWLKLIEMIFGGKNTLRRNGIKYESKKDKKNYFIVSGIVIEQGPNYALAKRIQHWRCMIAKNDGHFVSTNIAPSSKTASVVSNAQFAAAYGGMHHFKPMEIFYQETSNSVMAAILINNVRNKNSVSQPEKVLENPVDIFKYNSFHGGIWRNGYTMGSIGLISGGIYYLGAYQFYLVSGFGGFVGFCLYSLKNPPRNWF